MIIQKRALITELEYYGLHRIQYSVFRGTVTTRRLTEIVSAAERICTEDDERVLITPLCATCVGRIIGIHERETDENPDFTVI